MVVFAGFGRAAFLVKTSATAVGDQQLIYTLPASIVLSVNAGTAIIATGFNAGRPVTIGSLPGADTQELTVGIEGANWGAFMLATGQMSSIQLNRKVGIGIKAATIPSSGAAEIVDALITENNIPVSFVGNLATGIAKPLTRVSAAPASTYEYQVVTASTKMVFHSSAAGQQIVYAPPRTYASIETIGVTPNPVFIREVAINGTVTGDYESAPGGEMILTVPKANYAGSFSGFDVAGPLKLEMKFNCIPTINGNPLGFQLDLPLTAI